MTIPSLSQVTWKQRLRLFVFNKQEFMPFTVWHILSYLAVWVFVAHIIIWSRGTSSLTEALWFASMAVVPGIIAIHQFWRRFYAACLVQDKHQAFYYMSLTLAHYFFVTAPIWVDIVFLCDAIYREKHLTENVAWYILWYFGMFFAFWFVLYGFAAVFFLFSFIPIFSVAALCYFLVNSFKRS